MSEVPQFYQEPDRQPTDRSSYERRGRLRLYAEEIATWAGVFTVLPLSVEGLRILLQNQFERTQYDPFSVFVPVSIISAIVGSALGAYFAQGMYQDQNRSS